MSASDAVILLLADGFVAVGRVLRGLRRPSGAEVRAQAHVDALNALEDSQDGLEPGQLTAAQQAAVDLGVNLANRAVAYGDQICAAYVDAFKPSPDFTAQRSAAVTVPAADNTTDCGCDHDCGCARLLRNPETLKRLLEAVDEDEAVEVLLEEDTAAVDGTQLAGSLEDAWHYHRAAVGYSSSAHDGVLWMCEGCSWHGRTEQAHARHRFQVLADMKNATTRVQEQLGGTA